MKEIKKSLSILTATAILATGSIAVLPERTFANCMMNVQAAESIATGECGENLTWTLDSAGTLTISGKGAMTNWSSSGAVPWYSYQEDILMPELSRRTDLKLYNNLLSTCYKR